MRFGGRRMSCGLRKSGLWVDRGGAVAVIVALTGTVLILAAGLTFDIARTLWVKQSIQADVDRAAMTAAAVAYSENPGSAPNQTAMSDAMRRYLAETGKHLPALVTLQAPKITYNPKPRDDLTVSVAAEIATAFLKILSIDEIEVKVEATVKRPEAGPMELALVLDRTWSMSASLGGVQKSVTLRNAATSLVDRVMTTDNARVGVVPFAMWVNVDQSLWSQPWLSVPAPQTITWNTSCSGCERFTCTIDGLPASCTRCSACTRTTAIWPFSGCIGMRSSKRDSIADPSTPPYPGLITLGNCVQTPILDLTAKSDSNGTGVSLVKTRIAQMVPVFSSLVTETFIPGGLVWGWNMLNSAMPLTRASTAAEAKSKGISKFLVLMTDGDNTVRPSGSSFVIQNPPTEANALTTSLCNNIKADGIYIFTVAFSVENSTTQTMLKNCASKPEYFYLASNNLALESAFRQIGDSLTRLRLMR